MVEDEVLVMENMRKSTIKLYEIKPLLQDMARNKAKIDKFKFAYNKVEFEVVVLVERQPFELMFGVVGYNFSFILKLKKGYEIENLSDEVFYRLKDILKLKPSKEGFNSYKFLRYFAQKIPQKYSDKKIQPHEIAKYKKTIIPESEKIYFKGWKLYNNSNKHAKNFEKTRILLGDDAYIFCKNNDVSSCWTDNPQKRIDYYTPQKYYNKQS